MTSVPLPPRSRACRHPARTGRTASRGATTRRSRRWSWPTASVSTRTTTTGRTRGCNDVPGMFTGSGMPMRFARADGSMIDVYQATTQMTDESGQTLPADTSTRCSITRSGPKATTACSPRTCTPTAPSQPRVRSDRRFGTDARRAGRVARSRCSTGSTAATGRRFGSFSWSNNTLAFSISVGARRARPPGDGADRIRQPAR